MYLNLFFVFGFVIFLISKKKFQKNFWHHPRTQQSTKPPNHPTTQHPSTQHPTTQHPTHHTTHTTLHPPNHPVRHPKHQKQSPNIFCSHTHCYNCDLLNMSFIMAVHMTQQCPGSVFTDTGVDTGAVLVTSFTVRAR